MGRKRKTNSFESTQPFKKTKLNESIDSFLDSSDEDDQQKPDISDIINDVIEKEHHLQQNPFLDDNNTNNKDIDLQTNTDYNQLNEFHGNDNFEFEADEFAELSNIEQSNLSNDDF